MFSLSILLSYENCMFYYFSIRQKFFSTDKTTLTFLFNCHIKKAINFHHHDAVIIPTGILVFILTNIFVLIFKQSKLYT